MGCTPSPYKLDQVLYMHHQSTLPATRDSRRRNCNRTTTYTINDRRTDDVTNLRYGLLEISNHFQIAKMFLYIRHFLRFNQRLKNAVINIQEITKTITTYSLKYS